MTEGVDEIALSRCEACHASFLPSDGPCPRCGSTDVKMYLSPPFGVVLAATEVTSPAEGWKPPHRLALIELPQSVRVLAILDGAVPINGDVVAVRRDGDVYRARSEPGAARS